MNSNTFQKYAIEAIEEGHNILVAVPIQEEYAIEAIEEGHNILVAVPIQEVVRVYPWGILRCIFGMFKYIIPIKTIQSSTKYHCDILETC